MKTLLTTIILMVSLWCPAQTVNVTNTLSLRYVLSDYNDTTDVNFIYVTNDKSTNSPVYSIESKTDTSDWKLVYYIVYVRHTNYPVIVVYSNKGNQVTSIVGNRVILHETITEPASYRLKPILP